MTKSRVHLISQGECLASVAGDVGMLRDKIWNDAANKKLRGDRDPFLLRPGDRLTIPAPEPKEESRTTEQRHRYRRKIEPTKLHIRVLENDEPRADVAWTLLHAGRVIAEGTTSADGEIETDIDPQLSKLTLRCGPTEKLEQYHLLVGSLNPLETVSGVQARLFNLGIDPGPVDDLFGPLTKSAVRVFQHEHDLDPNGRINNATRSALRDAHGC
jgi:putative peptidoglycan binding protein